ncbi:glycine cleavage system transcriptional repressor [Geothermobacter ehrlichii]|uniref:Glycine cleavage system transcriptional repressor n=1 Tax=Geothermobacter ehrlichii TaxID=213224 RepID=A0A5D3WJ65_9BACT|nr:ACT domain-containing protein [Geothermobacter ehrlichii]TYO98973.1 glycine cleavage system transcriptional repressor [Geothermobacter ehrlichii]
MHHFALTIIGRDRPGIVSRVTEILYHMGCNIADSSCSILGGQFAMQLIISHPEYDRGEQLRGFFSPLEEENLSVFLRTLRPGGEKRSELKGDLCMVSVYGSDRPGIVYRVARELGERGINITDLNTKLIGSEQRPVYVMMLEATLPPEISVEELDRIMARVREDLGVDVSVRSINPVEL